MNILVTGSNGQLGQEIKKLSSGLGHKFYFTDVEELDITNVDQVRSYIGQSRIDFIVNCAAYTAVDKAESEVQKAALINKIGPANLANVSKELDVTLLHISTDFVFDGSKKTPYIETDETNPISVYGRTKLDGENEIIKNASTFAIIRTSWLYSEYGYNFVKTITRLAKERPEIKIVSDQIGSPTYAGDLAKVIIEIIPKMEKGTKEIFHYSNEGAASWYDFAVKIVELNNLKCKVHPIPSAEYPTPAKRPAYSVMDKTKIKKYFGLSIPAWQDSLVSCINNMRVNL